MRLIGDHHRIEIGFQPRDARMNHREDVAAERVHFRVEFAADHAVAQINQARARIFLHHGRAFLQRFQNDDSGGLFDRLWRGRRNIEVTRAALLGLVERFTGRREHFRNERRNLLALALERLRHALDADRVPHLKRPQLPAESPAHRAVHVHDAVRNFRNATRGVETSLAKTRPKELIRLVAAFAFKRRADEHAQTGSRVVNALPRFDGSKF